MKLLAIETATESCSVALLIDDQLVMRSEVAPRRHAELLLSMCDAVLDESGISRSAIDAVAVGRGPGAFTGVRLAISAAQGIALGINRPIVAVSSLAALALSAPDNGALTVSIIDARMGEIYAGSFVRDAHWLIRAIGAESVGAADRLELPSLSANFIGSGWNAYHSALSTRLLHPPLYADGDRFPQAEMIARLAQPMFASGLAVDPSDVRPTYLRDNVALTTTQQKEGKVALSGETT